MSDIGGMYGDFLGHHYTIQGDKLDLIIEEVERELENAVIKFPQFPTDPLHALAILGEEYGELNKAVLQFTYEPHKTSKDEIRSEAIQTAAMAIRFLLSLEDFAYIAAQQHNQEI